MTTRLSISQVYDKIAQNEAAAYEGTEIAVIDEKGSLFAYHPQMAIQSEVTIISEMDCGECFALVSPAVGNIFSPKKFSFRVIILHSNLLSSINLFGYPS